MWAVAFKKKKRGGEVDNLFVCLLLIKDARYTNVCEAMPNLAIYFKAAILCSYDLSACMCGLM